MPRSGPEGASHKRCLSPSFRPRDPIHLLARRHADYTYDDTDQLTGADYSYQTDETYTYDANGNRTNTGYVIGADNRLLSDGTYTYWYGAEGNRTARFIDADHDGLLDSRDTDVAEYTWDTRNRLVKVTNYATCGGSPTQIVDYLYDAEDRWIGEAIDSNGDGTTDRQIRFAYDGNQIVLEFEKDGAGGVMAANLSHRYLWDPAAVDHVLADEQFSPLPPGEGQDEGFGLSTPGSVVWPLTDNLGTVRDLAIYDAQTGATTVVSHRIYDSFGNLRSKSGALDCLFGFTGRALDAATGLQNNLHRWYDAHAGLWMSEDPTAFAAGDANLHRYVGNGPTYATDPTGLQSCVICEADAQAVVENALSHGRGLKQIVISSEMHGAYNPGVDGMNSILAYLRNERWDVLELRGHAHYWHRITLGDQHKLYGYVATGAGIGIVPRGFRQYEINPQNAYREGAKLIQKPNLNDYAVIVICSCYLGIDTMKAQKDGTRSVAQEVADATGKLVLTPCFTCAAGPDVPASSYNHETKPQVRQDLIDHHIPVDEVDYWLDNYAWPVGNWCLTATDHSNS